MPRANQNAQGTIPEEEIKLGFKIHNIRTSLKALTVSTSAADTKRQFMITNYLALYNAIVNRDISAFI